MPTPWPRGAHLVTMLTLRGAASVPDTFCLRPNLVLDECQLWVGLGEPRCHLRDGTLKGQVGQKRGVCSWGASDCVLEALSEPPILGGRIQKPKQ